MNVLNPNDVRIGSYQNDPDNDMNRYDEVLVALRRIIRATDLHSRQLSKIAGLTAPQLLILQLLRQHTELTVGEVAQRVSLSQATVTTIIDRLEKRGFVKRERGRAEITIQEKPVRNRARCQDDDELRKIRGNGLGIAPIIDSHQRRLT